jgi:hypothetical protein
MLERPENGELPEAEKVDRLPTREATQTPDVKSICQSSPIVFPQGVDIPEHADNGCGYSRLVIAKKTAKDEICYPLMISELVGGSSLSLLKRSPKYRILKEGLILPLIASGTSMLRISKALVPDTGSLGGALPPKRMPRMALQFTGSTPISQVLRWKVPVW